MSLHHVKCSVYLLQSMEPLSIMRTVVDTRAVFVPPPWVGLLPPTLGRGAPPSADWLWAGVHLFSSPTPPLLPLAGPGKHYYTTVDGLHNPWDQCHGASTYACTR